MLQLISWMSKSENCVKYKYRLPAAVEKEEESAKCKSRLPAAVPNATQEAADCMGSQGKKKKSVVSKAGLTRSFHTSPGGRQCITQKEQ